MSLTDPIADYLTRLRNANSARHEVFEIPASKIKVQMSEILKNEGFVKNYEFIKNELQGVLRVTLKYGPNNEKVISGLKRISKPGLRVYANADDMPKVLNGLGIAIVSTSNGVVTDKAARAQHIGGEVLAYVW